MIFVLSPQEQKAEALQPILQALTKLSIEGKIRAADYQGARYYTVKKP
jgi:hypothetical protein